MIARPAIPTGVVNGQVSDAARDLGLTGVSAGAELAGQVDQTLLQRQNRKPLPGDEMAANLLSPAAYALLGVTK